MIFEDYFLILNTVLLIIDVFNQFYYAQSMVLCMDLHDFGPCLITGGAGFIGSHLAEKLNSLNVHVKILDNFSSGNTSNLESLSSKKNIEIINDDLNNLDNIPDLLKNIKTVFHFAAYPEVRTGFEKPEIAYEENIKNTFHLLELIRKSEVKHIVFSSSSVVYGEADLIPTPETYGPLLPISPYGGSKLACEGLISSYCNNFNIHGVMLRLANVIGSRSRHGVIWDFLNKLQINSNKLEILGNGKQTKSYIHVSDCIDGFLFSLINSKNKVDVYNIGNSDKIDVFEIGKIVCNTMNLSQTELKTKGGTIDGGGWIGDVTLMLLDISKLKNLGWKPHFTSRESVIKSSKELFSELNNL